MYLVSVQEYVGTVKNIPKHLQEKYYLRITTNNEYGILIFISKNNTEETKLVEELKNYIRIITIDDWMQDIILSNLIISEDISIRPKTVTTFEK